MSRHAACVPDPACLSRHAARHHVLPVPACPVTARTAPRRVRRIEPWFIPFALVNGAAVGLSPILLPLVAAAQGAGHVGLVMGTFNIGAFAAPVAGALADRYRSYRGIAVACAALSAVSLWLFPLASPAVQLPLALADGAGFAGAVTVANLLIVELRPQSEWNQRLGWLETALSVGQGGALVLAAWLTGLGARGGLMIAALVPAAAIPLALVLIPRVPGAPGPVPRAGGPPRAAAQAPGAPAGEQRAARAGHRLHDVGMVGEWGPASPSRVHHLHQRRRPLAGLRRSAALLRGRFGWLLAAWIPAYAGSAIVFSLYPVLFQHAFGVAPRTSSLAFAVIVFVSLPIFALAGRISQRRGPAAALAGALAARVVLLAVLAALAAAGQVPVVLPLAAFSGVLFAWSFLSVASPGLTGQLVPQAEGKAQGILAASSGLAGFAGSVAGGLAAARWGYPAALGIGSGATAAGLIIFTATLLRPSRRMPVPPDPRAPRAPGAPADG
jgi:MFS transporter, DHA1 family, tetracycline resistance protein